MILGLSIAAFTKLHVAISLIGIVSGLVVLYGNAGRAADARLDGAVSRDHRAHQRDRVHVPRHYRYAGGDLRRHLARGARRGAACPLCVPGKRSLAMDLCRHRPVCALSQCIRSGGAGVSKDCLPASARRTAPSRRSWWRRPSYCSPSCGWGLARCGNSTPRRWRRRDADQSYRPV